MKVFALILVALALTLASCEHAAPSVSFRSDAGDVREFALVLDDRLIIDEADAHLWTSGKIGDVRAYVQEGDSITRLWLQGAKYWKHGKATR